jgi:hypothetical protein
MEPDVTTISKFLSDSGVIGDSITNDSTLMLIGTAMVAMGFTGYNAGVFGATRILTTLIMSLTIALLIMLIVDLDRPFRGLIQVSVQALVDAARGIPP